MISPDVFRMGKTYKLVNLGEVYEFEIIEFIGSNDYFLKDIHTLETYYFNELLQYGRGRDYSLEEKDTK